MRLQSQNLQASLQIVMTQFARALRTVGDGTGQIACEAIDLSGVCSCNRSETMWGGISINGGMELLTPGKQPAAEAGFACLSVIVLQLLRLGTVVMLYLQACCNG